MGKNRNENTNNGVQMSSSEILTEERINRDIARKKKSVFICVCVVVIAIILGFVLSCTIFFPIENVTVVNINSENKKISEYYTEEEIRNVAAVEAGKNLILLDTNGIAERITSVLPYIGFAQVKRKLPGTVVISVEDTSAVFGVKDANNYVLFNDKGKVLDNKSNSLPKNCIFVTGVEINNSELSTTVTFTDNSKYTRLCELYEGFKKYELNNVTKINLKNIIEIKFVCDNRITFNFGDSSDFDGKMKIAAETYKEETAEKSNDHIIVDLTVEKKAYVRPDSELEEIETTTKTVTTQKSTEATTKNEKTTKKKTEATTNETTVAETTTKEKHYYG